MGVPRSIVESGPTLIRDDATNDMLRCAFERSPSGISIVALDGRWLRINDAHCRMLGYESDDLLGAAVCDLTHPDDVAADQEFMASALAGGPDTLEMQEALHAHRRVGIVGACPSRADPRRGGAACLFRLAPERCHRASHGAGAKPKQ